MRKLSFFKQIFYMNPAKKQNRGESNSFIKILSIVTNTPFDIYGKSALILSLCHVLTFSGKFKVAHISKDIKFKR